MPAFGRMGGAAVGTDTAPAAVFGPAPKHLSPGHRLTSRYLTVRDGTGLAADVYLPDGLGTAPVTTVLATTPYFRRLAPRGRLAARLLSRAGLGGDNRWWPRLAEFGYATVVVEQRGTGASFGQRPKTVQQLIEDMVDVTDWIVEQEWSDGHVVPIGVSAVGLSAQLAAASGHPAISVTMPMFSSFDVYLATHPGGLPLSSAVGEVVAMMRALDTNALHRIAPNAVARIAMRLLLRGLMPVDADHDGSLLRAAIEEHARNEYHPALATVPEYRDDAMPDGWQSIDEQSPFMHADAMREAGVRVAAYGGWWDTGSAVEMMQSVHSVSPDTGRLVIGPWGHGGSFQAGPGLARTRRRSEFDMAADIARVLASLSERVWGSDILYWTFGDETWKRADRWPVPSMPTTMWLTEDGALCDAAPEETRPYGFAVDPTAATGATSRWALVAHVFRGVAYPRGRGTGRVLTFTSAPLPMDTEITGHPQLSLTVSTTRADGALIAYLLDVDEAGGASYITEGLLRLSARSPGDLLYEPLPGRVPRSCRRSDAVPMTPGVAEGVTLDLLPISYAVRRGHRLRLEISGADAAHLRTPHADDPGVLTVHTGDGSFIELPVVRP